LYVKVIYEPEISRRFAVEVLEQNFSAIKVDSERYVANLSEVNPLPPNDAVQKDLF